LIWNCEGDKVYCSNGLSSSVSVIDCAQDSVLITIAVGEKPTGLVWNAINNKVYCANSDDNTVTIIDGIEDTVITTVQVGTEPHALLWDSTYNKIYVANYESDDITIIDGNTNQVLTTVEVGHWPRTMVLNSINNRVYVANYYGSSISVIKDVTGIKEIDTECEMLDTELRISPNPFKSFTIVCFYPPADHRLRLEIYDIVGRSVKTFKLKVRSKEPITIIWDGKDNSGKRLPAGVYFVKLDIGTWSMLEKVILLR